ncbi:MAG TPA: septum site-determining protein MinC, partial [Phycisphaeraceae bacterium]
MAARPVARVAESEERGEAALVQRTLRSGQVVRHQGHLTVLGDVNPGAEVIAGGSVVVWGRVRGTVHAGALGDRSAQICALELAPTQLRIADL